ncbi:hypothetical protein SAMN04487775_101359 [Treponema bryantii]|uniref:Outer membrane protein beta-barrel domain-containing protein n=1 Tax=Treponema bryantii TaxID=163 RepID=A0A1I3I6N1_9SPIR|nr:hypothetical protein [Treponema bryantii]SFI43549.1 hypothetical protein SAMN04487775_101359 [Treponema bryantii]
MFGRKLKILSFSVLLLCFSSKLFALEEYVSEIYKQIDTCFSAKDDSKLNTILSRNVNDRYYYLMENYTQKKIRRLIVNNEYDFAMAATLVVIENNLDNEEAVEMYSMISDAYEIQKKHEAELEHQRQLELARIQMEKEKQRGSVEKEYVAASQTSTGAVYVSGKETNLTSTNWKLKIGMVDLLHLYEKESEISTIHYGVCLDFNYKYTMETKNVLGLDLFAGAQFLAIADEEKLVPLLADAEAAVKYAFAKLSKNMFIRVGFNAIITGKSELAIETDGVLNNFYSPFVGIKFEDIPLGNMRLDFAADWLAGHLFVKDVKAAAGAALNIAIPFAELEKVKLNLNVGLRDRFFLKNEGMENRASLILALGVENVVR